MLVVRILAKPGKFMRTSATDDEIEKIEAEHASMLQEKEANDLEIAKIKAQLIEARAQV
jgi:hypothetical protein